MGFARMHRYCLSAIVLPAIILSCVLPAEAFGGKEVRDWQATCEADLECHALTYTGGEWVQSAGIVRSSKANAPAAFTFSHRGELKPGSLIRLSVPGKLAELVLPSDAGATDEWGNEWTYDGAEIGAELVPAMKAGKTIRVEIETLEGSFSQELSLSGFAAMLIFLDESQDRIGKTDALYEPGSAPATGRKSRARTLRAETDIPAEVLAAWGARPHECRDEERDLIADLGAFAIELNAEDKSTLYVIPCGGPGAYNAPYMAFAHEPGEFGFVRTLAFPTMGDQGPTVVNSVYNPYWDELSGHLLSFFRGRGIGDCGTQSTWEYTDASAWGNFQLVEERIKDDCDGQDTEFPLVWPLQ